MIYDFALIGAGIAGASLAAELAAAGARVIVLEAEDAPGYHATGRSAAFWEECYGGPEIVPLTLASGSYLRGLGVLRPRGALYIGRDGDAAELQAFVDRFNSTGANIERLDRNALEAQVPGLRPEWTGAVWEAACADIDVAKLHQHYLAAARRDGAQFEMRARIASAVRANGCWTLTAQDARSWQAKAVVNAAGAWADSFAQMAGARPLAIRPLRRTVVQLRTDPLPPPDLPLVLDIAGAFYFKPESGRLWLSPHDEEPSPPCDAAPEELAVATAIDRFEQVVDWQVISVERRWAGLRSFAPDRQPVYGWDPLVEGFAWFAGQGGYGIQTAPAAARLMAQILLDQPRDAMTERLSSHLYAPNRFF